MNKIILLSAFFIISFVKAQDKIVFKNGTVKTGKIGFKFFNSQKIKLKKDDNSEELIDVKTIKYIEQLNPKNETIIKSIFMPVKIEGKFKKMIVLMEGDVMLLGLQRYKASMTENGFDPSNGHSTSDYYILRDGEEFATFLASFSHIGGKSFKKVVKEYFKDCPKLVEKALNKEFKKKHYKEVVMYYNNNCDSD
ncbi:MAG: hypothetical protein HRT68_14800 [Flavobacteriaceae bacterium]|nr:hypothetical protein [Flavobacteriaceae bacterium]